MRARENTSRTFRGVNRDRLDLERFELRPGAYRERQRCFEHHDIEHYHSRNAHCTHTTHRRERSREGRATNTWDAADTSAQRRPKRGIWTLRYMNGPGNMLVTLTCRLSETRQVR